MPLSGPPDHAAVRAPPDHAAAGPVGRGVADVGSTRIRLQNRGVASPWTAVEALEAVRDLMLPADPRSGSTSGWKPERVELEGSEVLLVVFEVGCEQFGVRYSLADMSEGPQTGLPCATPAAWARDLWGDIDEEVATGVVGRADRLEGPEGLTLLRWWAGLSDVRT